ncbi:MAG: hypothetical protein RLZZ453_851 [Chlamydiota bacterium]|jgi:hypothetical protein
MTLSFFQKKLRSFTKRFFLPLINQSSAYLVQHLPEAKTPLPFDDYRSLWITNNKKNNDADLVRLLFLIHNVQEILENNVPGAFAELGVYKGNSAKLLHTLAPEKKLYLFDTFESFSSDDIAKDPKAKIHIHHFLDTSLSQVKEFIGESEKIVFCPGYFPDTASNVPVDEIFALVHLDADLYAPTKAGLEFFYPRLSPKGALIIHDYFSGAWPGVKQAVDEFLKDKPESLVRIPDKSGTVILKKMAV